MKSVTVRTVKRSMISFWDQPRTYILRAYRWAWKLRLSVKERVNKVSITDWKTALAYVVSSGSHSCRMFRLDQRIAKNGKTAHRRNHALPNIISEHLNMNSSTWHGNRRSSKRESDLRRWRTLETCLPLGGRIRLLRAPTRKHYMSLQGYHQ